MTRSRQERAQQAIVRGVMRAGRQLGVRLTEVEIAEALIDANGLLDYAERGEQLLRTKAREQGVRLPPEWA
jgi:hypothetical protein